MKQLISILLILLSINTSLAQQLAPVKVVVTDLKENIKPGETIVFEGLTSKEKFIGTTNHLGYFKLKLPGGETYAIKIKRIGKMQDYYNFEIPSLADNQQYSEAEVTISFELPKVITLENLEFDSGKATIKASSKETLNDLLDFLIRKEKIKISVEGHTDNIGDNISNQKLSLLRAVAVKKWLLEKGINSERIYTVGYGEEKPVASNDNSIGRQKNRRTEVRFVQ